MGRSKLYASDAERQRAYRARLKVSHITAASTTVKKRPRRPPSRPRRLAALQEAAEDLQNEYQTWLDSVPDSLQDSSQATRLTETIESLGEVVDLLSQLDPPRGFGRD